MTLEEATILLVEDEPPLLKLYGIWFAREGSRVLLAQNGAEARGLAHQNHIDLIISDICMPVMDGIEMARSLNDQDSHTPQMLFVSGYTDVENRDLYDIGAAGKLQKPIRRQELVEAARQCLLAKSEKWSTPLTLEEGMINELVSETSDNVTLLDRISFGRGGLCLNTNAYLLPKRLIRLSLMNQLDAPAEIVAIVRWIKPEQYLAGLEIRYVDPIGRAAVIHMTDHVTENVFIPRMVGHGRS